MILVLFIIYSCNSNSKRNVDQNQNENATTESELYENDEPYLEYYDSIRIGNQHWSTRNLDCCTFRNGDSIPEANTDEEWEMASENGTPACCYYDNDPANSETYGRLYNFFALSDPRGIAPDGWHIPSNEEWKLMFYFLGGENVAGEKLKSGEGWIENGNGDNSSRFNAYPGGYRDSGGKFENIGKSGYWWTSTEISSISGYQWLISYSSPEIDQLERPKGGGYSVRCIKN